MKKGAMMLSYAFGAPSGSYSSDRRVSSRGEVVMLLTGQGKEKGKLKNKEEFTRLFCQFTENPNDKDLYTSMRQAFIGLNSYRPYETGEFHRFSECIHSGDYKAAAFLDTAIMYSWMLSPEYHLLRHQLYTMLHDYERASYARWLAEVLLNAMLESGNGSEEQPYLVTSVSDIYALIEVVCGGISEYCIGQTVSCKNGRHIDRVHVASEQFLYFDVTAMIASQPAGCVFVSSKERFSERFQEFLDHGSVEIFQSLRDDVIAKRSKLSLHLAAFPEFDPSEESLASLSVCVRRYLNQEQPERALMLLDAVCDHFAVCPGFYRIKEFVYSYMGNHEERLAARACEKKVLSGILGTGDGSIERPFLVTRSDDVCLLMELFEEEIAGEHCDFFQGHCYLCILSDSGNAYYFDFTDVLSLS